MTQTTEGDAPVRFPRLRRFLKPRRGISNTEKTAAALLLLATLVALAWANWPMAVEYEEFWESPAMLRLGDVVFQLDFRQLVNEALMTLFFFVVGLEVKREFALGELSSWSRAVVPVLAAVAGLALPALLFLAFNPSGEAAYGWGIVISTDTAFLIGALAIVGPRLPGHLRTFLLALAVVDDVGALAVIALFYTDRLALVPMLIAVAGLAIIWSIRFLRVGQEQAYVVCSIAVWIALYLSGVHPTLAGVAIALVLPVHSPRLTDVERAAQLGRVFRQSPGPDYALAATRGLNRAVSVNHRLYVLYSPYASFVILPLFALANAGVMLDPETLRSAVTSPLTIGIVVGLVVGKLVGITVTTAAVRGLRIGVLAPGVTLGRVAGGAALSGIGFTISLFIVELSVTDPRLQEEARVGVLAASAIAFVLGWLVFRVIDRIQPPSSMSLVLARPVDPARDHIRGGADARLTLVEYGDFECPFCSRATGSVDEVIAHFGDDVQYVWRHLPLTRYHPHAELAARASEAAALQGQFFPYGRALFANQKHLEPGDLLVYARQVGLDLVRFEEDLNSPRVINRVKDDTTDAELMDVHQTPTFFVNGRRHTGHWDTDTLIGALDGLPPRHPADRRSGRKNR